MIPLAVVNQGASTTEITISGKHINLDLFWHFEMSMRRQPRGSENVFFTLTPDADIISTSVDIPALSVSDKWPSGSGTITVLNKGTITGRGGKGGTGAYIYRRDGLTSRSHMPHDTVTGKINSTAGGNGGIAIKNLSNTRLIVNNAGHIYGGGGGGGGGGAYALGFAIFSQKVANTTYLSLSPDGYRIMAMFGGGGAGGGGAPYGDEGLTTFSLPWLADKYPEVKTDVQMLLAKVESLESSDRLLRSTIGVRSNGLVNIRVAPPHNFYPGNPDISNRSYSGFENIADILYNKLKVSKNRYFQAGLNISDAKQREYRPYLPRYDTQYESRYLDDKYHFYHPAQSSNWTGSGDSNIAGYPLVAQPKQQPGTRHNGGVGGALYESTLRDGSSDMQFGGWKRDSSTGLMRELRDSKDSFCGGSGGNPGEDGGDGILDRIYYRGGEGGNKYRYFTLDHTTRMDTLPPAPGGKAGYVKQGNVTINNIDGGITKGR